MQKGKKPDNISPSLSVTISAKLCRENERKDGSGSFRSIAFRFKDSWASFILNDDDSLHPVIRRNGEVVENKISLNLGDEDGIHMLNFNEFKDAIASQIRIRYPW